MTTNHRFLAGLAAGAVLGAAAGLLLAPKTGKETRHVVATGAGELRHTASHYLGALRQEQANGRDLENAQLSR